MMISSVAIGVAAISKEVDHGSIQLSNFGELAIGPTC